MTDEEAMQLVGALTHKHCTEHQEMEAWAHLCAAVADRSRLRRALVQLLSVPAGFGPRVAVALRAAGGTEEAIATYLPGIAANLAAEQEKTKPGKPPTE